MHFGCEATKLTTVLISGHYWGIIIDKCSIQINELQYHGGGSKLILSIVLQAAKMQITDAQRNGFFFLLTSVLKCNVQ